MKLPIELVEIIISFIGTKTSLKKLPRQYKSIRNRCSKIQDILAWRQSREDDLLHKHSLIIECLRRGDTHHIGSEDTKEGYDLVLKTFKFYGWRATYTYTLCVNVDHHDLINDVFVAGVGSDAWKNFEWNNSLSSYESYWDFLDLNYKRELTYMDRQVA